MSAVEHCLFCFDVLSTNLEGKEPISLDNIKKTLPSYFKDQNGDASNPTSAFTPSSTSSSSASIIESPLFVTWNTVSPGSSHRSLRGCIGTFESQELSSGLESYTLISALQDTRFSPISKSELPSLEVSVTLLTDFEDTEDQMDWDLGTHGLKITFYFKGRRYNSCYLPDVPVEQGWTKEETLVSLMRKAGWNGRKDKWMEVDKFKGTRFQGKALSLDYEEYRKWKKWAAKQEEA
ncbi:related to ammecr1 protein [Rhynchosporium secalis]|uniref:Related to ammecr1 protein n=1 Tax=Rhynchosporium secalis TaxID=38038 RepID=A0A1E1LUC6_RHYSE|nr:related to ammecr1 protein [Rhynchosporium secalis]